MQFIFLALFLCSQYAASVPVDSLVQSQDPGAGLRLHLVPEVWFAANLICQLEGGVLASPSTSALAKEMQAAMADHKLKLVFIGVTDMVTRGDFKSLDGAAVAEIPLEWAAGEPNNAGDDEHCLALTCAGALGDVRCSTVLPYFCRKESARESRDHDDEVPPCNGKSGYEYEPRTGSCYKFHAAAQTWLPALKTCHAEGGHLAIINNQAESTVLKEMLDKNKGYVTGEFSSDYVTIGFMKSDDGKWVTIHGATLSEAGFTKWAPGEPSNWQAIENCGSIRNDGLLNDAKCRLAYPFICEITP